MLKNKWMNKRGDIAVTLLILMAVVLVSTSLFIFNTNTNKVSAEITDSRFLDKTYFKEDRINFYVNEAIEKAIIGFNGDKAKFIEKFKSELDKYNITAVGNEIENIKNNINEGNIEVKDKKLIVSIKIKIDDKLEDKVIISYLYDKKFEKSF